MPPILVYSTGATDTVNIQNRLLYRPLEAGLLRGVLWPIASGAKARLYSVSSALRRCPAFGTEMRLTRAKYVDFLLFAADCKNEVDFWGLSSMSDRFGFNAARQWVAGHSEVAFCSEEGLQ
jgi:hypothetical protein